MNGKNILAASLHEHCNMTEHMQANMNLHNIYTIPYFNLKIH